MAIPPLILPPGEGGNNTGTSRRPEGWVDYGQRLKELRIQGRMTQKDLAEPNYTGAYVSTIEAGKRMPSQDANNHFAARLGVDPDELYTGRGPRLRAHLESILNDARVALASDNAGKAERLLQQVERESEGAGMHRLKSRALQMRARREEAAGKIERAVALWEEAELALGGGFPMAETDCVAGRARCYLLLGDPHYAVHLLEAHLSAQRRAGIEEPDSLGRIYTALITAYSTSGLRDQARELAARALELTARVEDPETLGAMYVSAARSLADDNKSEEAGRCFARAEDIFRAADSRVELAAVYLAHGTSLIDRGRLDGAGPPLEEAAEIFGGAGDVAGGRGVKLQLGRLARLSGRVAEARSHLDAVLASAHEETVVERGLATRELALCEEADGRLKPAEETIRRAVDLLEESGERRAVASTLRELGDMMQRANELSKASEAYRKAAVTLGAG